MPIKIPYELPAYNKLYNENIFVMSKDRAEHQDIRPLKIIILNIMPKKIETETQILRLLSNTPLQVDIELLHMISHRSKNTPQDVYKRQIYDICADIDISDSDACNCAIKYGKINIIAYNILSFMSCFFRLKKKHININCVYNQPESVYNFSFIVKFTPSSGILSVIAFRCV